MKEKLKLFFRQSFFSNKKYISALILFFAVASALKQYSVEKFNNYLIYKNVFFHTINKTSLYSEYPLEYFDHNHYGPIFGLVIAPFAILPDAFGMTLWNFFNGLLLIFAVYKLPIKASKINLILWIIANEFITATLGFQFNPMMTSIIILSFVFIHQERDFWAAFFIILGTFVKLYGIVGLAFFFFSKHKIKLIASLILWSIILLVLPMVISSKEFILNSYLEWFERLVLKNSENASLDSMQDISIMGIFRRIFNDPTLSNIPFLLFGLFLFGLPYLRFNLYKNIRFRLLMLSSVLIFTVIFSSGSESPTYIIAFLGVAIWFITHTKPISIGNLFLLIFALIVTSLSPTDLMPDFIYDKLLKPYALKALPCVLIWFKIIHEMLTIKLDEDDFYLIK